MRRAPLGYLSHRHLTKRTRNQLLAAHGTTRHKERASETESLARQISFLQTVLANQLSLP